MAGRSAGGTAGAAPRDLDHVIARLLTIGTYVSISVLAVGWLLMLAGGISTTDTPPTLDPGAIPGELLALHATGFLWLGLLAVIATPTTRIVVALIGYLRGGEREMAVISAAILAGITLSVILARLVEA